MNEPTDRSDVDAGGVTSTRTAPATAGRLRSSAGVVSLGVAGVVLVALLAGVFGTGNSGRVFNFTDGKAWLPNNGRGSVALVDGATGSPEFEMRFEGIAGDDLEVIQGEEGVFVLNRVTGEITRIDEAGMDVTGTRDTDEAQNPLMVMGAGRAYVVLLATGRVQEIDPASDDLAPKGEPIELGSPASSAVVDRSGRLAAAVPAAGEIRWIDGSRPLGGVRVGQPGDPLRVTSVDGVVVAVDHAQTLVAVMATDHIERTYRLDIPKDGELKLADAMSGDRVWALHMPSARLVGVRLADGETRSLQLSFAEGNALGAPLPNGDFVYVPDLDQGSLLQVDARSGDFVDVIKVAEDDPDYDDPTKGFDAFVKDGKVWGNDPDSDQAVVVDRSGKVERVEKYRPGMPSNEDGALLITPPDSVPDDAEDPTDPKDPQRDPEDPAEDPAKGPTETTIPDRGNPPEADPIPDTNDDALRKLPPVGAAPDELGSTNGSTPPGGDSDPGAPTEPPAPVAGVPSAPGSATATPDDGQATVTWLPAVDNGSPLLRYEVTTSTGGTKEVGAAVTTTDITGLANGVAVTFTVRAVNAIGTGPGATSPSITPAAALPAAVAGFTADLRSHPFDDANRTEISPFLSWDEPTVPVTDFLVGCRRPTDPVGTTAIVAADRTSHMILGLQVGLGYRCFVEARNADGVSGPRSESTTLLYPWGQPDAVVITTDLGTPLWESDQTIMWNPPVSDGGRLLKRYIVCVQIWDQSQAEACFNTFGPQITLSLTPEQYSLRIYAVNGASEASEIIGKMASDTFTVQSAMPSTTIPVTTTTGP